MRGFGRYGRFICGVFTFVDFALLNVSYLIAGLWSGLDGAFFSRQVWLLLNLSFLIVVSIFPSIHNKRVVYADQVLLQVVKVVAVLGAVFLSFLYFLDWFQNFDTSFPEILKLFFVFFCLLVFWWIFSRKFLKWCRSKGVNYRRIIIIGGGTVGKRLMEELESDQGYGYRINGFFDNNPKAKKMKGYAGTLDKVESFVKENLIDEMYCAVPDMDNDVVSDMIKIAERNAVDFYYVPQFGRNITRRFVLDSVGNVPVLSIRPYPLSNPINRAAKRIFDIVVSSLVLLLSPIVLIPVAIGIKLSSPGPVFFKQKRTGYRGQPFDCYKFRTMKVNTDSDKVQASKDDPRKTKFGDFLRRTSIDELPQFYNVLVGNMSIVGPRPHMIKHTEAYSRLIDKYMIRHTIKPGITGWAQVNGYRGQTDQLWKMEKRVEFDVWYAENWNYMLDLKIIFLTVLHVFTGDKNAY